jgi:hypothetical protein
MNNEKIKGKILGELFKIFEKNSNLKVKLGIEFIYHYGGRYFLKSITLNKYPLMYYYNIKTKKNFHSFDFHDIFKTFSITTLQYILIRIKNATETKTN